MHCPSQDSSAHKKQERSWTGAYSTDAVLGPQAEDPERTRVLRAILTVLAIIPHSEPVSSMGPKKKKGWPSLKSHRKTPKVRFFSMCFDILDTMLKIAKSDIYKSSTLVVQHYNLLYMRAPPAHSA